MLGNTATAQPFQLPPDYYDRFGDLGGEFNHDNKAYGVRYFPLPIKYDLRIIFVTHPEYNEYGISTRYKETDILLGILEGGAKGIRTLEINHNPDEGLQAHLYLESPNSDKDESYLNYGEVGYRKFLKLKSLPDVKVTLYGGAGYAGTQHDGSQAYTHFKVNADRSFEHVIKPVGTQVDLAIDVKTALENYYFVSDSKAYTTAKLDVGVRGKLNDRTDVYASQYELYDFGKADNNIYGLASSKDRDSYAGILYHLDYKVGPINIHTLQYDYTRYWYYNSDTDNRSEIGATLRFNLTAPIRLDITPGYDFYWGGPTLEGAALIRMSQFKSAFGPSLKYTWLPNNQHRWAFKVVVSDKDN